MSTKVEPKSNSKSKINIKGKYTNLKQKNNYSSLTPNKYQKQKEGIIYNDKININNNTALSPHHNNYNINNNISININIDMSNNKPKPISKLKNKSQLKNIPIRIKKGEFKNTNSLIFNTLKNYTNKNNQKKSPFHIRIKSANMGLKDFKCNNNNKINNKIIIKNSSNTNIKKNFNLTTSGFNKKKEEENNNNKTSFDPKNISIENIIINDRNKVKEVKKDYSVSITNDNSNNDKKLFKNKSNQIQQPQKIKNKKRYNFSPTINRELLNQKQNIILNYSIGNKKNNIINNKTMINDNKNKALKPKIKNSKSPFTHNKNISLKTKNNLIQKDFSLNIANLISRNQILNNNKKQIMNYKAKSPMLKIDLKNSKLNNAGKLRTIYKNDLNLKNNNLQNKNLNKTNQQKNINEKPKSDDEKKTNRSNIDIVHIQNEEKDNNIKKENMKIEEESKKKEEKKNEGEKKKEEEKKKKEEKKKEEKKKIIDEKKKEGEQNQKQKKPEKHIKENDKKKILSQSKSQNDIGSDFIKKQLDNKKIDTSEQNIKPSDPAIKKLNRIESICKKGFAGPGIKKTNQDNFFIYKNFLENKDNIFLGVCDGHGMYGQDISGYLVNHLPQNLNNSFIKENIKSISSQKDYEKISSIISLTFVQTNINLVNDDKVDSTFSGTTCSSLLFCPQKIISANVGDSRCVLGKFDGKNWKAKNLTRDHKPNEEDEKKRINEKGGRIEAYKDEEGDFVGPERVWLKGEDLPGLAMSRSFGDDIAHTVGVISQPEIFEYQLLNEDKFILLGSDGIWEFISSDECVNIVKDYYLKDDIDGALSYLYKESSRRWIMEEEVIDDITLIIMFLN